MCHVGGLEFWFVGSILEIHFLISQTLIEKFVMEPAPPTIQVLVLPISKVGNCYPICYLSWVSQYSNSALSRNGDD